MNGITIEGARNRYPHLRFARNWDLTAHAMYELGQCDALVRAISNTPILPVYYSELLALSLSKGAQATTAIEGNTLTDDEIARVARGQSLPPSKGYQEKEVKNILDAYNAILALAVGDGIEQRITPELLLHFHKMIGKDLGEHFDAVPGQLRTDTRFVGPYRCPNHEHVRNLVEFLCNWLPQEFHFGSGQTFAEAVVQAIVTHVYIEWIHPFGDGNGRTGRLVEFYVLLRAGTPDIASHILSNFYNETRSEYYRQLQVANSKRDLTGFIEYAVIGLSDGLLRTLETIQQSQFKLTWIKLIYDRFAEKKYTKRNVFRRQRMLALSFPTNTPVTLTEVPLINPEVAREYANLSGRTVRRDIDVLIELGILNEHDDQFFANTGALRGQLARRTRGASAV
jgi:Fic family protein